VAGQGISVQLIWIDNRVTRIKATWASELLSDRNNVDQNLMASR